MKFSVKAASPVTVGLKIDDSTILLDKDAALKLATHLNQEANKIGRTTKSKRKSKFSLSK